MLDTANVWQTRELRTPSHPLVEWLPLATLGDPECTIGILKDGAWVVDTADGLADLRVSHNMTFGLSLLNSAPEIIRGLIASLSKDIHLNKERVDEFPLNRLIVHAISSGGYWAERGLCWLPQVELCTDERAAVIIGLKAIEDNKIFAQSLRHEARKHRRKMQTEVT